MSCLRQYGERFLVQVRAFLLSAILIVSLMLNGGYGTPESPELAEEREMVEVTYYTADGSTCCQFEGDQAGDACDKPWTKKVERLRYYGADGKPTMIEDGYFEKKTILEREVKEGKCGNSEEGEEDTYVMTTSYFDQAGKACMPPELGFASMRLERYPGRAMSSYSDAKGNPCISKVFLKVAKMEVIWDKEKPSSMQEDRYLGFVPSGKLEILSFGVDGKPMLNQNGVAREFGQEQVTKDGKREIHFSYYGVNGEPKAFMHKYEKAIVRYGEDGNMSEIEALSFDGSPKNVTFGPYAFYKVEAKGDVVNLINVAGKIVKTFKADDFKEAWAEFLADDSDRDYREE